MYRIYTKIDDEDNDMLCEIDSIPDTGLSQDYYCSNFVQALVQDNSKTDAPVLICNEHKELLKQRGLAY